MYGGSYNGFTQWAAAKYADPHLKTIVPVVPNNPGNGLPMQNSIFLLVNYPWIYYVTNNKFLDTSAYDDPKFRGLALRWYKSGRAYRDVDAIAGVPNPWLHNGWSIRLRRLLASDEPVPHGLRANQHSRADDRRLLRRQHSASGISAISMGTIRRRAII